MVNTIDHSLPWNNSFIWLLTSTIWFSSYLFCYSFLVFFAGSSSSWPLNIGEFQGSALCSLLYLHSFLGNLIQSNSFKYQLYVKDSQIKSPSKSSFLNSRFIFSIAYLHLHSWMANRHVWNWPIDICPILKTSTTHPFPHIRWWLIHPFRIWGQHLGVILHSFLKLQF